MLISSIIFMDAFSSWSNPCPQILHVLCCICSVGTCTVQKSQTRSLYVTQHRMHYAILITVRHIVNLALASLSKKAMSHHPTLSPSLSHVKSLSHPIHHTAAATTSSTDPVNLLPATPRVEASPLGTFPVAASPKYHAPISVSSPFCVNSAELGPTLDTEERNPPK